MASYAELTAGTLLLATTRNGIDPTLMWLFRESDKFVEEIDRSNPARLGKYIIEEAIDSFDEQNPFVCIGYRCPASHIKDRLELKGYTRRIAESAFAECLKNEIGARNRRSELFPSISGLFDETMGVLNSLTCETWLAALKRISVEKLTAQRLDDLSEDDSDLPKLRYMLRQSSGMYGFPGEGADLFWLFLRLAIEVMPPDEPFEYDISDLVDAGWIDEAVDLVSAAEGGLHSDLQLAQSVIVLTEGETDRRYLYRSLNLLWPHLAEYFHFFEFTLRKGGRIGGGAGELVNLVRALASANVRHRILALFDNDTAAKAALSNLDLSGLPENIAVRVFPDIVLAKNYPARGPTGTSWMDVNGWAGSLELYLGKEVLEGFDGNLSPVQWTGFNSKLNAYQGEVLDKNGIQKRFEGKLSHCEAHQDELMLYDWDGIQAILDVMFTAFHEIDSEQILGSIDSE